MPASLIMAYTGGLPVEQVELSVRSGPVKSTFC